MGWCAPTKAQGTRERRRGQTLGQMGPKAHTPCASLSSPLVAATHRWVWGCRPSSGGHPRGGAPSSPSPIYMRPRGCPKHAIRSLVGAALHLFFLLSCGAWRSPAGLPRSSITTTPSCCCWMESSPTSPSLLAGSRRGRRHRAARVLNAEAPFFRCLDRNQPRSESLRVRLPHPRSCNASASRSTRVCRFTPLPLVARLLHRLILVMRRKF